MQPGFLTGSGNREASRHGDAINARTIRAVPLSGSSFPPSRLMQIPVQSSAGGAQPLSTATTVTILSHTRTFKAAPKGMVLPQMTV